MELRIDGKAIEARPGSSLLDMVRQLDMDTQRLSDRPIAAKIAGEVFNLNYIPVRDKDANPDRPSIRRAMAASGGEVHLLRYSDPTGKDVYARTAQFVLFLALHRLYPGARAKMNCTVGAGLYIAVSGAENFSVRALKEEVRRIVSSDIPLIRRRISTAEAVRRFRDMGQEDKARLLSWRREDYFDQYAYEDFMDYYYGELAPTTGYLQVWDILPVAGGFMFIYPDDLEPDLGADYQEMPNFFSVYNEGDHWGELMECETVADLNGLVESGRIRELIRVNEALHEKK